MSRGDQLQRHLNLMRLLQTRGEGVPLAQLADHFGVSERTIQRDLELLQSEGFPVSFDEDAFGKRFWRMPANFFNTGALTLSLTEAMSLHLARRVLAPLRGTHLADGLQSVLDRIESLLPAQAMEYFAGLGDRLYVRPFAATDYSAHAGIIRTIDEAVQQDRVLELTYRSLWRGETYTTGCDPYGLVLHLDDLFLIGRSHRAGELRIFKISRIQEVRATEAEFERPDDFNLVNLFRSSFGIVRTEGEPVDIEVRFSGVAAAVVEERIWHHSQELAWLPAEATLFAEGGTDEGSLIARFRLAELAEFKRWLKGFGDGAEVLKPAWLRGEIRSELLAAAARYAL